VTFRLQLISHFSDILVFGFFEDQFIGKESNESYSLKLGYLSGPPVNTDFVLASISVILNSSAGEYH